MPRRTGKVIISNNIRALSNFNIRGILRALGKGDWVSVKEISVADGRSIAKTRAALTRLQKGIIKNLRVEFRACQRRQCQLEVRQVR